MFAGETLRAAGGPVRQTLPQTDTSTGKKQMTILKANLQDNLDKVDNLLDSASLKIVAFLRKLLVQLDETEIWHLYLQLSWEHKQISY